MLSYEELTEKWIRAKAMERVSVAKRREAEDEIVKRCGIVVDHDFVDRVTLGGCAVKITGRVSKKVDPVKLQVVAAEVGLTEHLSTLFRWKPEINIAIWKATDQSITDSLACAITSTPGRPSFQITEKGE